jgi:hypothetical protein
MVALASPGSVHEDVVNVAARVYVPTFVPEAFDEYRHVIVPPPASILCNQLLALLLQFTPGYPLASCKINVL